MKNTNMSDIILSESILKMAEHYANIIEKSGVKPTLAEVESAVANNWSKISNQIETLSSKVSEII